MAFVSPLILPADGSDPRRIGAGEALTGSGKAISLFHGSASIGITASVTTDSLLTGSDFQWNPNAYQAPGCLAYLEINAAVSVAGLTLAVSLYADGALVPGSTLTAATVGGKLYRTGALAIPASASLLQVMAHANGAANLVGTAIIYVARLLLI